MRKILYCMFLTLVVTSFVSCSDDNDTVYGELNMQGQVADDQGNPIANAVVTLYNTGEGEYAQSATTDEDGNYSLLQCKCTDEIYISIDADGYFADGITYKLQFSDAVPGITLGTARLIQDFTLQKQ